MCYGLRLMICLQWRTFSNCLVPSIVKVESLEFGETCYVPNKCKYNLPFAIRLSCVVIMSHCDFKNFDPAFSSRVSWSYVNHIWPLLFTCFWHCIQTFFELMTDWVGPLSISWICWTPARSISVIETKRWHEGPK